MVTQAQMMTKVREDRVNETTARFYTDNNLRRWINEGIRDIARRVEYAQTFADITAIISPVTREYTLATNVLRVHRVEWRPTASGQIYPLAMMDYNVMDTLWATQQAVTVARPEAVSFWGYPPTLKMVVYPAPQEAGSYRVFYYKVPTALVETAATDQNIALDIPMGWEDLIPDFVEYCALRKARDPRWMEAKNLYEESIARMETRVLQWTDEVGMIAEGAGSGLPGWLVNDYWE
jgi:hypothetical protein